MDDALARRTTQHALQCCTPVITSLPRKETTRFVERIQKLRHRADYESVGLATRTQVDELGKVVEKLQTAVMELVR